MIATTTESNVDWGMGIRSKNVVSGRLMNFRINSTTLRSDHEQWLEQYVVPVLRAGGSVTIAGHASRSGNAAYNRRLSLKRAKAVHEFLRSRVGRPFAVRHIEGLGESAAAERGVKDGSELGYDRAVTLYASPRPTPPKPEPFRGGPPVSRIVTRAWKETMSTDSGATSKESAYAKLGKQLRSGLKDLKDPNRHEVKSRRRTRSVPQRYVVVEVIHISQTTIRKGPVGVSTVFTDFEDTIIWRWGPPTPTIKVTHHKTVFRRGSMTEDTSHTRSYSRNDTSLPSVYVSPGDPFR